MDVMVLASTSPARRELLDRAGIVFETEAPGVDEVLVRDAPGVQQARALALAKARAVAVRHPGRVVVGADQVLVCDGRTFGKPADEAAARAQLGMLAGRTHALVTAIAICAPGRESVVDHEETHLTFRALTEADVRAYVATGEWQGCAGGYRVEGRGIALFERLDGDWTNVLGLPMPRLLGHLRVLGIDPLHL